MRIQDLSHRAAAEPQASRLSGRLACGSAAASRQPGPERLACGSVAASRQLGLSLLVVAGCGSYTTYQTAEPLPRGRWQGAVALGPGLFRDDPGESKLPSVHVELAARRGVGADTDVGLKLYTVGWEASVRHRFVETDTGWSIAGLAALGGLRSTGDGPMPDAMAGHVRATAVFTKRTSRRWAYSFGPVATGSLYLPAAGGHATGVMGGAFGNAEWAFGTKWRLLPELSLHRTISGDVPVDGVVVQLGIGMNRNF